MIIAHQEGAQTAVPREIIEPLDLVVREVYRIELILSNLRGNERQAHSTQKNMQISTRNKRRKPTKTKPQPQNEAKRNRRYRTEGTRRGHPRAHARGTIPNGTAQPTRRLRTQSSSLQQHLESFPAIPVQSVSWDKTGIPRDPRRFTSEVLKIQSGNSRLHRMPQPPVPEFPHRLE